MSTCAAGRVWQNVRCECEHSAVDHTSEAVNEVGCTRCICRLTRERVLFAIAEHSIAEVCEHRERVSARRAPLRAV